jgi:hypothetical protein
MRSSRFLWALALLAAPWAPASAADLAKIDRTIVREPTYRSAVKYCLLVFGPEAKSRVWLVQDGGTLYVDRNGNGDLTEAGERVAARKGDYTNPDEGLISFEGGDVRDGTLTHKNLRVSVLKLDYLADTDEQVKAYLAKDPKARRYSLWIEVEMPGRKGNGVGGRVEQYVSVRDNHDFLRFGDRPQEAPVIHFGGPWQVTLFGRRKFTVGRETDLLLGVGTPGLGACTTAYVAYEGVIPDKVYPKVEITYPPKRQGATPVKELYELKERC